MAKTKPTLTLLRASKAKDVSMLAKMFKRMTGREPTARELADARKKVAK